MNNLQNLIYAIVILLALSFTSCQSTEDVGQEEYVEDTSVIEDNDVVLVDEEEVKLVSEEELEYSRSVAGLEGQISYDVFQADKNEILAIIEKLSESMETKDYQTWRSLLTPSSISYWSNRMNLQVLSARLPGDDVILRDLPQYFTNMFIPSRIGRNVTEIRYESLTAVKAVQVEGDTDIIYYDFVKENGKWLVSLPRL